MANKFLTKFVNSDHKNDLQAKFQKKISVELPKTKKLKPDPKVRHGSKRLVSFHFADRVLANSVLLNGLSDSEANRKSDSSSDL